MGLEAAGMTTVFQCEIDKHARSVLDYHWPDVPKWDDVSTLTGAHILEVTGGVDVVAWGSPCQDLSLAGKRAGLTGERSGLFHQGIRIIKELRELSNGKYPTWSIWENVVGALSSNGGADFGEVLYEMDEAGACFSEWAVLDAQYFGVPQRRRRVFITSCFDSATSERCGSPLLPVSESLRGDSAKGIKKGQGITREVEDCVGAGSELGSGKEVANAITASLYHHGTVVNQDANNGHLVVESVETYAKSRRAQSSTDAETWVESDVTPTLNVFDVGDTRATTAIVEPVLSFDTQFGSNANVFEDQSPTLKASQQSPSVTQSADPVLMRQREGKPGGGKGPLLSDTSLTLQAANDQTLFQPSDSPMLIDGRRVDDVRVYTEPVQTLQERMGTGGNNVPVVAQETIIIDRSSFNTGIEFDRDPGIEVSETMPTIVARGPHAVAQEPILIDRAAFNQGENAQYEPYISDDPISPSIVARGPHAVGQEVQALSYDGYNQTIEEEIHRPWRIGKDSGEFIADLREPTLIVRRLTPLECERLMGWPDNHTAQGTNGAVSDTQRFKMCGNGVASPVAQWIAGHILNV